MELKPAIALSHFAPIGPKTFHQILKSQIPLESLWQVSLSQLEFAGLSKATALKFIDWRKANPIDSLADPVLNSKIKVITLSDPSYPSLLKQDENAPPVLFYIGDLSATAKPCLAIVGTREPTPYGTEICNLIIPPIAREQIPIVSGLARGIDSLAHQLTVDNNGLGIAVLGFGHNSLAGEKLKLAETLIERGGLVLSQWPPSVAAQKYHFPVRNRTIAGLSKVIMVIEAGLDSGSLITAKHALELNRDLAAIPGLITKPTSAGTNQLLKSGAHVILSANDLLSLFGREIKLQTQSWSTSTNGQLTVGTANAALTNPNDISDPILKILASGPQSAEELSLKLASPIASILGDLSLLEIEGKLEAHHGLYYYRLP